MHGRVERRAGRRERPDPAGRGQRAGREAAEPLRAGPRSARVVIREAALAGQAHGAAAEVAVDVALVQHARETDVGREGQGSLAAEGREFGD